MSCRRALPCLFSLLLAACSQPNAPGVGLETPDAGPLGTGGDGGQNGVNEDGGPGSTSSSSSGEASSSSTAASSSGGTGTSSTGGSTSSASSSSGGGSSSSSSGGASSSSSSSGGGTACQSSRDCELGQVCIQSICVPGCESENDCPNNEICDTATLPHGACVECLQPTDCPFDGAVCTEGQCRLSCSDQEPCPQPLTCRDDGICVRCVEDAQCGPQRICEANECVEGCRNDGACPPGSVCESLQCVAGCRASPNSCPLGSICDETLGEAGVCVSGCVEASDCGDPANFTCENGQCVQSCLGDDNCPQGSICDQGTCVEGCRPPNRGCPRGQYCDASGSGQAGQCLTGCDSNEDCSFQRENICNPDTHSCVECMVTEDCTFGGNVQSTCNQDNLCETTCDPNGWDYCQISGFFCEADPNNPDTGVCVECVEDADCDEFEQCNNSRCEAQAGRPLCAPCETDDQCGDGNDLCVRHVVFGQVENVCGVDCSNGEACPAGTTCQQVGGQNGQPVRGQQCLPSNSVHEATCSARRDMIDELECNRSSECGMLGFANQGGDGDAICSGAGLSEGHCTVFCDMNGNDCPEGFFCEDPPDQGNTEYRPRCSPQP
ncbi:MAG: hypothetical protein AB2A00_10465 [Myxococcota bacterium]